VENIEQMELDGHRSQIIADMKSMVEKYRSIFDWDIPEINQNIADKLILAAFASHWTTSKRTCFNLETSVTA